MQVSEIVCSHSQTPFNASRIGCLVDQRGKGIESVIINNFSHSMKTLYDLLSPLFRKIEESVVICCNRIRDVVRDKYIRSKFYRE